MTAFIIYLIGAVLAFIITFAQRNFWFGKGEQLIGVVLTTFGWPLFFVMLVLALVLASVMYVINSVTENRKKQH